MMNHDDWMRQYGDEAATEGWSLFECSDKDHAPIELQALADADNGYAWEVEPEFHDCDDQGAWGFVVRQALAGSLCHQAALAVLRDHAPTEFVFITSQVVLGVFS